MVDEIAADLMDNDLATRVDKSTASLGRRYARADELGVPFAITVDFQTLSDSTVTLRERDSTKQIRLGRDDVTQIIYKIVHSKVTWADLIQKYPVVQVEEGEGNNGSSEPEPGAATVVETTSRGRFRRPAPSN